MMTLAIVIASIVGYGFMGGVTHAWITHRDGDDVDAGLGCLFWPVVLPGLLGAIIANRVHRRLTAPRRLELPRAVVRKP